MDYAALLTCDNLQVSIFPPRGSPICVDLNKNERSYDLSGLSAYTKYEVSVRASVMGRVQRIGAAGTCTFQTEPGGKSYVSLLPSFLQKAQRVCI